MKRNKISHAVAFLCLTMVFTILTSQAPVRTQTSSGVVPVDQVTFGKTYAELSAEWWQWVLGIRVASNPLLDTTGEFCAVKQADSSSPFWFLAGTFGGSAHRSCTIPHGKLLFFPLINVVAFDPDPNETVDDLRRLAAAFINDTRSLEAVIDGRSLTDLFGQRVVSPVFSFTVPGGGLIDPGLHSPAVSDGFWLLLEPLSSGTHEVHFGGRVAGANVRPFSVDVTYTLTVM